MVNLSNSNPNIIVYQNDQFRINNQVINVIHQYNSHKSIHKKVDEFISKLATSNF